jgi:ribosome-binding protein aMBF1 (putative translation factor)
MLKLSVSSRGGMAMGTKLSDYLAKSKAADTAEDAALREAFAASFKLGLQLRDAREKQGITQAELSRKSGIPETDIRRIERGDCSPAEPAVTSLTSALEIA